MEANGSFENSCPGERSQGESGLQPKYLAVNRMGLWNIEALKPGPRGEEGGEETPAEGG